MIVGFDDWGFADWELGIGGLIYGFGTRSVALIIALPLRP